VSAGDDERTLPHTPDNVRLSLQLLWKTNISSWLYLAFKFDQYHLRYLVTAPRMRIDGTLGEAGYLKKTYLPLPSSNIRLCARPNGTDSVSCSRTANDMQHCNRFACQVTLKSANHNVKLVDTAVNDIRQTRQPRCWNLRFSTVGKSLALTSIWSMDLQSPSTPIDRIQSRHVELSFHLHKVCF
jgi:hypothetical protein